MEVNAIWGCSCEKQPCSHTSVFPAEREYPTNYFDGYVSPAEALAMWARKLGRPLTDYEQKALKKYYETHYE